MFPSVKEDFLSGLFGKRDVEIEGLFGKRDLEIEGV
jgi:hypothetical protein